MCLTIPFTFRRLRTATASSCSFLHEFKRKPLTCFYHDEASPFRSLPRFSQLIAATFCFGKLDHVSKIHAKIITSGCISEHFIFTNLINSYAQCGHIDRALLLLCAANSGSKTIVTWTSLITRLSQTYRSFQSFYILHFMRRSGLFPNHVTYSAVLPACADTRLIIHGSQIHSLIYKHGYGRDIYITSGLISMYGNCFYMEDADKLFDEMSERNLVSWNSMIVGFLHNELYDRAVELFIGIPRDGTMLPDQVSFSSVLSASANMSNLGLGKQVHGLILKHGVMCFMYVKNSLLDFYNKCGTFDEAIKLFDGIGTKDVITWNIVLNGCIQNGNYERACEYFRAMRRRGYSPDEASSSTTLHASACIAALSIGSVIHDQIVKFGFMTTSCISSSLITMYSKCGCLADAFRAFEETIDRNVVCWTAIITACQLHGHMNRVIHLFEDMLLEGTKPDNITFVCVLSACSHTGRVEDGFMFFESITADHGLTPEIEHYACMVDLLGRSGRLEEAKRFVESMPMKPDASVWGSLLAACRSFGNFELGKEVAEKLFEIEPNNPGNYVLLANMYTRNGMQKEGEEVRRLMRASKVRKETGCSWIDVRNRTFMFTAHDRSNSMASEIYAVIEKLKELMRKKGYPTGTRGEVSEEENQWHHSERLALAFGILALPQTAPIRIKKNLRTCKDCHLVMKFASECIGREIIVRDINRFHQFVDGFCSCGDFW